MSDQPKTNRDADLRSFHSFISKLEGGALNEELTEKIKLAIQEISDACLDRGGKHKATVTLKLDFVMDHKDKIVEVYTDITEKMPKAPRGRAGMYFCDSEGNLTRENPRQLTLEDELERQRLRNAEKAAGV